MPPPPEAPSHPLSQTVAAKRVADAGALAKALAECRADDPGFVFAPGSSAEAFDIAASTPNELARRLAAVRARAAFPIDAGPVEAATCWTPRRVAEAEHRHGSADHGTGDFAVVRLRVVPLRAGEGNTFESEFAGPPEIDAFNAAVGRGVGRRLAGGLDGTGRIIDTRVVFIDGAFHSTRSTAAGFEAAAVIAMDTACRTAGLRRLEPLVEVDIQVGRDHVRPVVNDLVVCGGSEVRRQLTPAGVVVVAELPMRAFLAYGARLCALTEGRGKVLGEPRFTRFAEVRRT